MTLTKSHYVLVKLLCLSLPKLLSKALFYLICLSSIFINILNVFDVTIESYSTHHKQKNRNSNQLESPRSFHSFKLPVHIENSYEVEL